MTDPSSTGAALALVTGAAGGIGSAVVERLAGEGRRVVAADRDVAALHSLTERLRRIGLAVDPFPVDVSDPRDVTELVANVEDRLGPIDALAHVAGVLWTGSALSVSAEDWERSLAVNAGGVFHVGRAVGKRMSSRRRGSIVMVTSNAAFVPRMEMAAYAASKAAAEAFARCLALELARTGVRCNTVAPGSTDTTMLRGMDDAGGLGHAVAGEPASFRIGIPLGKVAAAADIADAVSFLLSTRASHITLHRLCVDGGASLGA